ncbi:DUF1328 domain-containing protein [Bacillus horti]|uniref:Uncharacterized membrane protein YtjA (UPF0391 family) n=1 Tax=Caldalkalibacillus horti TaxID=77523 RepID=A0ABT9W5M5_9BACI|nr:DUF1328 domain-containing protein [Bacillus horti]MDQ0168552.1 uncharacterized membrane protein YtjA (UPF0391 family) [Bacillus horti]
MLKWALIFLVVGAIFYLLGLRSIAGITIGIARVLFTIFVIIFLVMLVIGLINGTLF